MTIPFERYLNIRAAHTPTFSPDGARIVFITNITGVPQVWSVSARGGMGLASADAPSASANWPDQLTFDAERVLGVWYSPTDDQMIIARDVGGNENAQLFLLEGDGSQERRLTHDDGAMHIFGGWAADGQRITFAANRRGRGRYDVYVQAVAGGDAQMIWENDLPGIVIPSGFAPDGARVLVLFMHGSLDHDLYEVHIAARAASLLTPHTGAVRFGNPCRPLYGADNQSVYCVCDLDREFTGVQRLELATRALLPIAQPEAEVELVAASPDGQQLAWATNVDGAHTLTLYAMRTGATRIPRQLPTGVISPPPDSAGLVFSNDGKQLAFAFSTSRRTSDVWIWDLETDALRPVTQSSHAGIPTSTFVEPELIRYPAFDGRAIPAWLYRPVTRGKRAPVVIYVHGGPEGQTQPMFFPILQYLIYRGYAVLAPNVRGSTGLGKTYSHLDDVEKRMDSVADLAYAAHWLKTQPDVDGERVAVYGGSYGGFMVLAALTSYPDLWAAGVDVVGISNFVTFLENTGAYRRSAREAEYGSLTRDRALLTRISPLHYVERIRAPLLVIHGANDPRVPLQEAEQMVNALRARHIPVEFLVYPDEGHGLVRLENKLDAYPKMADFLDKHLKPDRS